MRRNKSQTILVFIPHLEDLIKYTAEVVTDCLNVEKHMHVGY